MKVRIVFTDEQTNQDTVEYVERNVSMEKVLDLQTELLKLNLKRVEIEKAKLDK